MVQVIDIIKQDIGTLLLMFILPTAIAIIIGYIDSNTKTYLTINLIAFIVSFVIMLIIRFLIF